MTDRLSCCVPFCRRTTKENFGEWVCGSHWRNVPSSIRDNFNAEKRRVRKIIARKPEYREWWKYPGGSSDRLAAVAMWRRYGNAWDACKAAAIEGEAGI